MALDYVGIEEALFTLLSSPGVSGVKKYYMEGMDRDISVVDNMPLVNIRLVEENGDVTSIPDAYYAFVTFEVDVITFDFSSFRDAAKLRDDIVKACKELIRGNRKFHNSLETSRIGNRVQFGAFSPEGGNGHIALATFTVIVEAYEDQ